MTLMSDDYSIPVLTLLETARDVVNWLGWQSADSTRGIFALKVFTPTRGSLALAVLPKMETSQLSLEFGMEQAEYAQLLLDEINAVVITHNHP